MLLRYLLFASVLAAGNSTSISRAFAATEVNWSSLKNLDVRVPLWTPEVGPALTDLETGASLEQDMTPYYRDFQSQGTVSIFLGYGYEAYTADRFRSVYETIKAASEQLHLGLVNWTAPSDLPKIAFTDPKSSVRYEITLGHERDEYARAFSQYDVIMYHGHSRYGRGPAFDSYFNYFRMGSVFNEIEVQAENPYFLKDRIQLTSQYPVKKIKIGGRSYDYQYRGQKVESSYLGSDPYVKNIPGLDTDLKKAKFKSGRQIIYLYSCENIHYFKKPLRRLFPNSDKKMVFGTTVPGYWSTAPEAALVLSVVRQIPQASGIVRELNATNDCGPDCFAAY